MNKEDIIKLSDGKIYYRFEYCDFLYSKLEELQSRIDKANELIQRHNKDTGNIYYKYNNRFVKSEFKERLSEVLNGSDKHETK